MTRKQRQEPARRLKSSGALVRCLELLLVSSGLVACAAPQPSPATTEPAGTGSTAASVHLNVRFAGRIGCATFPYNCTATLSVLEPNTDIPDAWRPPSTDPWWGPDYSQGTTGETFDPKPLGGSLAAAPGPHRLVLSLLGSYDTPSYSPDGSRAFDLLGRCTADLEIGPDARSVDVLVTFAPDPANFRATCTLEAGAP